MRKKRLAAGMLMISLTASLTTQAAIPEEAVPLEKADSIVSEIPQTEIPAPPDERPQYTISELPSDEAGNVPPTSADVPEIEETEIATPAHRSVSGWLIGSKGWWFLNTDGTYKKSEWSFIGNHWYYFDQNGWMLSNTWLGDYYLGADGSMSVNTWVGNYYVGADGKWIPGYQELPTGWILAGTRWWFRYEDGSFEKSGWKTINGQKYCFDQNGWMLSGWILENNIWYFLADSGEMKTNQWIGNYYLTADGSMAVNQWIGNYYVGADGVWIPNYTETKNGWQHTAEGYKYIDENGSFVKSSWKFIDNEWYYFDEDEIMHTGWLKASNDVWFYMDESGKMLAGQWVGDSYLADNGIMVKNSWYLISENWYYFGENGKKLVNQFIDDVYYMDQNGIMVTNTTLSIGDYIYTFDANGHVVLKEYRWVDVRDIINGKTVTLKLEKQYQTDAQVSDVDLLAASLYCEAGNQGLDGQIAVALVILNRVESPQFPTNLKYNIYNNNQFAIARDGSLTKWLNQLDKIPAQTRLAAQTAMDTMNSHKTSGTPLTIEGVVLPEEKTNFDYLFFMTHAAFERLQIDPVAGDAFILKDHVFFKNWVYKK